MIGSVQQIIVCSPQEGVTGKLPCGDGFTPVQTSAYVLADTSQSIIEGLTQPLDYSQSSQFFAISFISTVSFFLIVKLMGSIIKFISQNTR